MYIVKNPYKTHLMDLNLMYAGEYKRTRISLGEIFLTALPLVACIVLVTMSIQPDLEFFAECQNIPGGDICSISLK